jgi:uncharacterized delta-60 repeat protein
MKLYAPFSHRVLGFIISILLFTSFVFAAAGDVDTTFNSLISGVAPGVVNVVKTQPDGKILVAGAFTEVNGLSKFGLLRFNADQSLDTSFTTLDFFSGYGVGGPIDAIAIQPDGKIVVGGRLWGVNGVFRPGIYRLNADGTIDSTFFTVQLNADNMVKTIQILPNNQILVGGYFNINLGQINNFARLNSDGTFDASLPVTNLPQINHIAVLPDGKFITFSNSVTKYNSNGTLDSSFSTVTSSDGSINTAKLLPDGSLLIGGSFFTLNGFNQRRLAKISTDGSVDLTFNLNGSGVNTNLFQVCQIKDIELRSNGKIVILGDFTSYNSAAPNRRNIAQLNLDGTLDTSFDYPNTFYGPFTDAVILSDDKLLIGTIANSDTPPFIRLNPNGSLNSSNFISLTKNAQVKKFAQQPDGKIVIVGLFGAVGNSLKNSIARINTDGSLDSNFTPYYNLDLPHMTNVVAVQPDGKILVCDEEQTTFLKRLNPNGSFDSTFSSPGWVNEVVALPDGKILVGDNTRILRLNANGTTDSTFIGPGTLNGIVNKIIKQADGKIIIGGAFTQIGSSARGRVARLNADGTLDTTFNPPGGANNTIFDLDVQTDGKVVLAGQFTGLNGNSSRQNIGRLNADGTLDTTFAQTVSPSVLAVKVQSSGKILIGGNITQVGSTATNRLARLNTDGSLDTTFNASPNSTVSDIDLQTESRILVVGDFTRINGTSANRIARLTDNIVTTTAGKLFDFDGDGKADVSVYRASTNVWYRLLSGNSTLLQNNFGIAGDIPTPADFDGDGKTDLAIFRPSTGTFWYQSSINNAQIATQWGQNGDIPRPSDFDGDGKADFIIYRPNEFQWYRLGSTGQVSNRSFGLPFDKPVIGDFDGDGKSDMAIFRPSSGDWWYQSSVDNSQRATHFGASTDVPSPADFDGDGKTDFAVYRPSTGVWYVLNSSTGSATIVQFGIAEDKPVPADYDGDGKSDIAVFRPSTGLWYLLRSTSGFSALQFGISSDVPLPNSFVP